ncbi:MAG: hypothetical protein ACYTCU_01565 [Planctomycetota bacterium]|jgi:type II secretory pathway component GspD/PulD (secretin)
MKRPVILLVALALLSLGSGVAAQDRTQVERDRRDLLAQKTYVLVERYLANARAFEERLDLPAAERELIKARDLDPTNRVVLDTLHQIQALMGKPVGEVRSLAISAAERYEAQRQQMRMLAMVDLEQSQRLIAAGDYTMAAALARGVVNQINWSQADVGWGELAPRAQQLLAQAESLESGAGDTLKAAKQAEAYRLLQEEERQSVAREEMRLNSMLDGAYDRFLAQDYDGASALAGAVLDEDRDNPYALELVDAARDMTRTTRSRAYQERRREEVMRWRESMEAVRIPYNAILTAPDPDHWAEISRLRGSTRSMGLAEPDPEAEALRERMASARMDADFDEMTIVQVANNIFFNTDIPVSVDPEVVSDLDLAAEYVTLTGLRDLPVVSLLNIIVDQVGDELAWTIRNGRVYITMQEKAQGLPIVRVHNIQDLTFPITDFKGVDIRDIPLPGEAGDDNEETIFSSELDQVRLIEPDEVLNLVRENIARESWDLSDAYSIDFVDNQNLLVIHTPAVQGEVAAFLDDLRAFSTSMVTLEARFLAITDAFIEQVGTDLRGLGPGGNLGNVPGDELDDLGDDASQGLDNSGDGSGDPNAGAFFSGNDYQAALATEFFFGSALGELLSTVGGGAFQFAILGDDQFNLVMTAVEKSANAFEISAPIVSVYNTQRAFVTVVNQVSFVQGFDVDVANAAFIADPNIGVVQEGIVLDVRPTISFDRKYVTLDVQTTVANLARPIRTVTTNLGGDSTAVTFQLPRLDVQDAQTTVVVPDQGSVVLGGFKHVLYRNRTAEAPWFADIPVLSFFFQEKGLADEMTDLIIVMKATITDFSELEKRPVASR